MSSDTHFHERLHAIIEGMVQGVGFRQYTWREARRLWLTGWVRNRRDYRVEVVAEGTREALEVFLNLLHQGPSASIVRHVDAKWEPAHNKFSDFTIE